jgi:hypothetical protein
VRSVKEGGELDVMDGAVGAAPAGVDAGRLEAAAEYLRGEVLALRELGARHAELGSQIDLLRAERDAVANEYQKRYGELAGGHFVIDALRQLGMGRALNGSIAVRKSKRSAVKKARSSAHGAASAIDVMPPSAG